MRRSAIEILAVTLAVAATLPLVSRVLADGQTTTSGTSGALQAARDRAASRSHLLGRSGNRCFSAFTGLSAPIRWACSQPGWLSTRCSLFFPGLGAATWLFSLLADPGTIQQQVNKLRDVVPAEAYKLIEQQLVALSSKNSAGFSAAGVISLLLALYSARLAASSMMQALNAIYKLQETRGLIKTNAIAILFTVVAIVVFLLAIAVLVVLPALFRFIGFPPLVENFVRYLRWPVLAVLAVIALALTYRFGPNREGARWRWSRWR